MTEEIKVISASGFNTRAELENEVRNKIGLTSELKPDYLIKGTKQELSSLFLSHSNLFWGIRVEVVDDKGKKVKVKKAKKVEGRGKVHKSKLT